MIEIVPKTNNMFDVISNNINEKCDILTKKVDLLESEMSNFNKNFNLMLRKNDKQSKA